MGVIGNELKNRGFGDEAGSDWPGSGRSDLMKRGLMGWSEKGKRKGRVKSAFWHVPDECVMRSDLNFRVRS